MTVRAFLVLMVWTVFAVAVGDHVARDFAAPGLERTFAVLVITALLVAPVAWLLEKAGWIRGRFEWGRRRPSEAAQRQATGEGGR
jgi:hypothetical protein